MRLFSYNQRSSEAQSDIELCFVWKPLTKYNRTPVRFRHLSRKELFSFLVIKYATSNYHFPFPLFVHGMLIKQRYCLSSSLFRLKYIIATTSEKKIDKQTRRIIVIIIFGFASIFSLFKKWKKKIICWYGLVSYHLHIWSSPDLGQSHKARLKYRLIFSAFFDEIVAVLFSIKQAAHLNNKDKLLMLDKQFETRQSFSVSHVWK